MNVSTSPKHQHRKRWMFIFVFIFVGFLVLVVATSVSAQGLGPAAPNPLAQPDLPTEAEHSHGSMPKDHHHQHHHGSMPKDHHHHHHHHGSMPKDHHHHHGSMPKDHHHANFHKAPPSHGFPHAHSHHSIPIPTFLLPYLQNEAMVFHTCAIILATIPITFTYLFPSNLPWLLNQLLTAFASGTLLGDLFLHTLPSLPPFTYTYVFSGFLFFYVLQRCLFLLTGHTCHPSTHAPNSSSSTSRNTPSRSTITHVSTSRSTTYLQLLATFFHTFTNGFLLSVAFRQGLTQGVSSFLALGLHELPHRLSDYMLLQQGASVTFAKRAQFFIALSTLLGSLGAQHLPSWIFHPLIPVAHGGFMYIATTMILPGLLHSPLSGWKGMLCFFLETAAMAGGIWVMQKLA